MKIFIALLLLLVYGQFSYGTTRAAYVVLTVEEAAELGLIFSYENLNKLFPALDNVPISFTLETSLFTACKIDFVFFNATDEVGTDLFGAYIGQRSGKYQFRAKPEFLEKSYLSLECEADVPETDPDQYMLNIGQIIQAP